MKQLRHFIVFIALTLCYGCNQPVKDPSAGKSGKPEAIGSIMENLALKFLKSWEPPYDPEAALELFTQSNDFHVVIGGGYVCDSYNDWIEAVHSSMYHEKMHYQSYRHEVKYIRSVVLSPVSGVVTIVYIWDSVSNEGVHERTPGAITVACRKEKNGWKIVHYHGSHDEPEVVTD